jgi:hypothetical protein
MPLRKSGGTTSTTIENKITFERQCIGLYNFRRKAEYMLGVSSQTHSKNNKHTHKATSKL